MKLYIRLEAPFEWVRVGGKIVEAFGEVPGLADYPFSEEDELVGVVPGEWVTTHRISLPAKSKRQFMAAVPYALEESISEDVEKLHFICPHWKAGEQCTVYVVAKRKMHEWQALANEYQLPLEKLVAEHALLPVHDAADCSVALVATQAAAKPHIVANHQGIGVCTDPDFIDVLLMDVPMTSTIAVNNKELTEQLIADHPDRDFRFWGFGDKLAHWLEQSHAIPQDLYTDDFRPSVRRISWRSFALPIGLLAAATALIIIYDSYRYLSLHAELSAINAEQRQIITANFPEIEYVEPAKERFMMEQALQRMGGVQLQASAQSMLAETAAVLGGQKVTLSNVVYRDSQLVITCQLNDFSQVDQLTKELNARPQIRADLQSSAADDGQIIASYTISSTAS